MFKTIKFFLLITALFYSGLLTAQEGGMYYFKQGKLTEERAVEQLGLAPLSENARKEAAELFMEAGENYLMASRNLRDIRDFADFAAYRSFTLSAETYLFLNDYKSAMAASDSAVNLWSRFYSMPMELLMQPKNVREKGAVYMLKPEAEGDEFKDIYYRGRAAAAEAAYLSGKMDQARTYADEVSRIFGIPEITWKAHFILADANFQATQYCKAAEQAIISLEQASKTQPDAEESIIKACNLCVDKLINILDKSQEQNCLSKEEEGRIAIALANFRSRWNSYADAALRYGELAYSHKELSKELVVSMARAAERKNLQQEKEKWVNRLDEANKNASSEEWYAASDLYAEMGNHEKMVNAARKGYQKWAWENTHFAISTNPWMIYRKQYMIALDVIRPKVAHEFMYTSVARQNQFMIPADFTTFDLDKSFVTFSGFQLSYGWKYLIPKRSDKDYYSYIGPDFRFTKRNFKPEQVDAAFKDQGYQTYTIDGSGNNYDLTVIFGQIQRINWMYFDLFAGFGLGYKTLETDIPGGLENYKVTDYRFRPAAWNKLYIPLRAGFKLGIAFK